MALEKAARKQWKLRCPSSGLLLPCLGNPNNPQSPLPERVDFEPQDWHKPAAYCRKVDNTKNSKSSRTAAHLSDVEAFCPHSYIFRRPRYALLRHHAGIKIQDLRAYSATSDSDYRYSTLCRSQASTGAAAHLLAPCGRQNSHNRTAWSSSHPLPQKLPC